MEKACRFCGVLFRIKPSHFDEKFYCSPECRKNDWANQHSGNKNSNYKNAGWRICKNCGSEYHSYNKSRKYCSLKCAGEVNLPILAELTKSKRKFNYCPKCGIVIIKYYRKYCDKHNPNIKKINSCKVCGKTINSDRIYCSRKCRWKDHIKSIPQSICSICGDIVYKPYRKYCNKCWRKVRMTKRGYPRRIDQNQKDIVDALENVGCSVMDISSEGGGTPDLMVGRFNETFLIEVKNPKTKGKLNKLQQKWHSEWKGHVAIAYTVEDALRIVGAIE
jgi:hypothetical protein